jgi:hypothetical protein
MRLSPLFPDTLILGMEIRIKVYIVYCFTYKMCSVVLTTSSDMCGLGWVKSY